MGQPSSTAQELLGDGKLYYGDPCYDSSLGSSKQECEGKTGGSLALMVLKHYGIGGDPGPGSSCCPLDIVNQDPFQCINMSLMGSLLNGQYREVYADENGQARGVTVIPGETGGGFPRVQYCVPSFQASDLSNLVIVRSADPPPFRKCGKTWYEIAGASSMATFGTHTTHIFPGEGGAGDARGIKFTWGQVTGMGPSMSTDATCERGRFDQFGSLVYPEYDRKQIYNDGVVDMEEIEGFEQVLFWLVDVKYNLSDQDLATFSIQFTKSSDVPIPLGAIAGGGGGTAGSVQCISNGDTYNGHLIDFGPICDLSETGEGTGTDPHMWLYPDPASEDAAKDATCSDVQSSIKEAEKRKKWILEWADFSTPSFFGYGWAMSFINFNEENKWSVGSDICVDTPKDNMYESTSAVWGNGAPLSDYNFLSALNTTLVDFGEAKQGWRTMDLSNGTTWVESRPKDADEGRLIYSFRAEAPSKASKKYGNAPWWNPFCNYMMTRVSNRYASNVTTWTASQATAYKRAGYLFGWDDSLYLVDNLWAKVKISRPGIAVQGFGRSAATALNAISMRVKPVYQVDFPQAVGAAGENYDGWVDAYRDLANANQAYCKPLPTELSETEKLMEAQTGNTIDITIPFLFPDFNGATPNTVNSKSSFIILSEKCHQIAKFLYDYIKKQQDMDIKGYTYICGPPQSEGEIPQLGKLHEGRTINSISYNYQDGSAFTVTVETGPVQIGQAHAGSLTHKRVKGPIEVKGKVVNQGYGALYKVHVGGIGVINAWNMSKFPYEVGDKVSLTLYNHPGER